MPDKRHSRAGSLVPLSSVIRSARCMARIREKWPVSEERRSFCLSYAVGGVSALSSILPVGESGAGAGGGAQQHT